MHQFLSVVRSLIQFLKMYFPFNGEAFKNLNFRIERSRCALIELSFIRKSLPKKKIRKTEK